MAETLSSKSHNIYPERIALARKRRGQTRVSLAKALGVTDRTTQKYEKEGAPASAAPKLAKALGFPQEYFFRPVLDEIDAERVNFRAGRAAIRSARDSAVAAGSTGIEIMRWVEDRFTLPALNVPTFESIEPETAAQLLREEWGLGIKPLPNLVQLCESRGIFVMVLPDAALEVDAFSLWHEGRPYIFIARQKTPERARFDIAHELGHLVLHRHAPVDETSAAQEKEADIFASALLMPEPLLAQYFRPNPTVDEILECKQIFQVSAFAVATTLHKFGRMTDWIYRKVCVELTRRGYRTGEPDGMGSHEQSRLFPQVFGADKAGPVTVARIARELAVPEEDVLTLTFGTRFRVLQGIGEKLASTQELERPNLRLLS